MQYFSGHHFSDRGQADGRHLGGGAAPELPLPFPYRRLPFSPHHYHDSAHQDGSEFAKGNMSSLASVVAYGHFIRQESMS